MVYLLEPKEKKSLILLTSKTKLADLKFQSIARLELNGALLLSKLLKWAVEMYARRNLDVIAFGDSKIVLAWLNGHPSKWKTYIANRTSQILAGMTASQWRYIDTKSNPADCASRGLLPSELLKHPLWLYGPSLVDLQLNVTKSLALPDHQQLIFEESLKRNSLILHSTRAPPFPLFSKYSSHKKLLRVTTSILQFIVNGVKKLIQKSEKDAGSNRLNIKRYEKIINRFSNTEHQRQCYYEEIKCLNASKHLPYDSKLKGLSPFVDSYGIMRVGGRLQNSELSFAQKSNYPTTETSSRNKYY